MVVVLLQQRPRWGGLGHQAAQGEVQQKAKPRQKTDNTYGQQWTVGAWWINRIRCRVGRSDVGLPGLRRNG